ncbi:MAG TPA: carboxypeptidase regulatory-like domain-containing protein [Bryobacteraceae bacterium]|nr:carboxypeptidase regulatory-like domain-containing protein [Bryobacteraceae bacterium]
MAAQTRVAVWLLCLAAAAIEAIAQAPVGSLNGTVHDTSGAVMPGVAITVTNKDTGAERQVATGADGSFATASLPAGSYSVKALAQGFRTLVENATVQVGQTATVDLVMEVGAATEVVSVQGEAAQISYDSHEISGVITRERIQNLPLNGRDFLQLAMLEPGVTVSASNAGQYNQQFNVSILGASSTNNSVRITVDGATVQDSVTGGTQQNFSQEVVQEFQLSSTNFDLSNGIGAGGTVNIASRSGGNSFHGDGLFVYRDHNMAAYPYLARDPNEPASPFFQRKNEAYSLGGPVKKDKLFFFSSLEHSNQTAVFSSFPSDPLFSAFGVNAASPLHSNELFERIDWRISARHTAFVRYSHDGNSSFAPPALGDQPSDWNLNTNWADSGVFSLVSVLTPTTANEFRYSMTFWSNRLNPATAANCPAPCIGLGGPNIGIYGVSNFSIGPATNAPQSRILRRQIFTDNLSWQKGAHSLKFGGSWEYQIGYGTYAYASPAAVVLWSPELVQGFDQELAAAGLSAYQIHIPSTFNTVSDLARLPVAGFEMGVGDINQPPLWNRGNADHDNLLHVYAEDTWRIRPRFSLQYGLAWSYESNALNFDLTKPTYLTPILGPSGLGHEQHQPHDFSPMIGFTWAPTNDNKTVVRGGAALYYDTWDLFNRLIERALLGPQGTGRALLPDSLFFPDIAAINGFANLPGPFQPTALSSEPTSFTLLEFDRLFPVFLNGAVAELGPPGNTSLAVRNIQLFKTAPMSALIPVNFRLPYSEHASIGVQHQLRDDLAVSADFVFRQYMHQLITGADLNHYYSVHGPVIPRCTSADQQLDTSAECSAGVIEANVSGGRSHYAGLLLKLDKRFSHRTTGTLAYSYASQVGYNGIVDESNYFASWGPQAGHQILTGSILVDLPWKFQVSGITSFQSAPPFQPYVAGIDLNGNGSIAGGENILGGTPIPGIGYNQFNVSAGKGELAQLVNQFNTNYAGKADAYGLTIPTLTLPGSYSFPHSFNSQDLRLTKNIGLHGDRVQLAIYGECFNIFNIANLTGYAAALNEPNFGIPTQRTPNIFGSGGPRAFQLGARLSF